jgi:hypothetical protein
VPFPTPDETPFLLFSCFLGHFGFFFFRKKKVLARGKDCPRRGVKEGGTKGVKKPAVVR